MKDEEWKMIPKEENVDHINKGKDETVFFFFYLTYLVKIVKMSFCFLIIHC